MAILMSAIMSQPHHITEQTLESILQERSAFKNNPQIKIGGTSKIGLLTKFGVSLGGIAINPALNKVYVTNPSLNTVSVLDSNSGNTTKNILVGIGPSHIAVDSLTNKVYVANYISHTVSVIDGFTNTNIKNITVGDSPTYIDFGIIGNTI